MSFPDPSSEPEKEPWLSSSLSEVCDEARDVILPLLLLLLLLLLQLGLSLVLVVPVLGASTPFLLRCLSPLVSSISPSSAYFQLVVSSFSVPRTGATQIEANNVLLACKVWWCL